MKTQHFTDIYDHIH